MEEIKKERFLLPFLGIITILFFEKIRNSYSISFTIFIVSVIIFTNFPLLVIYSISKPLYYNDLFLDDKKLPNYLLPKNIRDKIEKIFVRALIFTNSISIALLSNYWLFKTDNEKSLFEIIGITGGILKILQITNNCLSFIILKILKWKVIYRARIHSQESISSDDEDERESLSPTNNIKSNIIKG